MPAAAPMPPRNDVANAQNGPSIDARPSIAIDSVVMANAVPCTNPVSANAAPPIIAVSAICQRRSPVRSEWRPMTTIPTAATAYGIALSQPMAKSPAPDALRTICGSQKPNA